MPIPPEQIRHYAWVAASPTDGLYSFIYSGMRYTGRYKDGVRDGAWRVLNPDGSDAWEVTWQSGEWHGLTVTWWKTGAKEDEGRHDWGKRTGVWRFWFNNGELAAEGEYRDDRKVGEWTYWDQGGSPMNYADWERKFHQWDWAYDDYSGFPRGENWPSPPPDCDPIPEP